MDRFGLSFLGGIAFLLIFLSFLWSGGNNRHDLAWTDRACVKVTERINDNRYGQSEICATGEEIAQWAKERGR
jgi:hypothetical protein